MAAMVFPSSPSVGDTYSAGGNTWSWSGTTWDAIFTIANLPGGSTGTVPYQSATGVTAQLAAGTSGQYLKSNGAAAPSWANVDALPSQTGQSGNYLTTNGTSASWAVVSTDPNPQIFLLMGA